MDQTDLRRLGALLHSHSWHDSCDWARALDELAQLSDRDVDVVVGVAAERPQQPSKTSATPTV